VTSTRSLINAIQAKLSNALLADRVAARRELGVIRAMAKGRASDDQLRARCERLDQRVSASVAARQRRLESQPLLHFDPDLPLCAKKEALLAAIRDHQVLIVAGETGSGKSTQLPKLCLAAGRGVDGVIGVTQPRRIAALTVGRRIAEEMHETLGQTVGVKIRFQDHTGEETRIKLMTDGILLAEAQSDRFLNRYDTLIVDEAHERSLNIDFILGMLKQLLDRRKDLKLIITSATIDTEKFARAFGDAPVIEVSGRMYPVEIRYAESRSQNGDDATHIEQAASALDQLHRGRLKGDVLVFMPTEQDIRDTCEILRGRRYPSAEVIPLFARLSTADQQRVFQPANGLKIIVATNVAETAVTIPGIRYVIDTGLARISQYTPRSRTNTLPVVPISQSSADQRMGRCGRVADGICIRLYSEEDYLQRPRYTLPEILRANLAEVILRMIALGLGDVAAFPFIDPPAPRSIQDGYSLLLELGAIEPAGPGHRTGGRYRLTEKGRLMARLPLDPRLACMLIEADRQGCLADVAIIAAALSIQDPRERPAERQAEADQAHTRFADPTSDFITLLRIWHRYRQVTAKRTSWQQVKQFCRENFLSFRRMREWREVLHQILGQLNEHGIRAKAPTKLSDEPGDIANSWYASIHRSILSGFLSNIALKKEKQIFQAAHQREAMVFPGSGIFKNPGQWIVAAEMVETSRLFARCAAAIDPAWIEPIGRAQCRYAYLDPHWERKREAVVATEQVTLYGLIIDRRTRPYGPVNPAEAAEIFIRHALVQGDVRRPLPFMTHNLELVEQIDEMQDRLRRRDLLVDEQFLMAFYAERLGHVYDMRTLKKTISQRGDDGFLRLRREDLLASHPDPDELALYPERIDAEGVQLRCEYRFDPGKENDGVTVHVPAPSAAGVAPETFQWLVPGLLKEKIAAMIKALPKELRKQLVPVADTVAIIARDMPIQRRIGLSSALSRFVKARWNVEIPPAAWDEGQLPDHLRMRIAVTDAKGNVVQTARDPGILQRVSTGSAIDDFREAQQRWEKSPIESWEDVGDLPDEIALKGPGGRRWTAYPALMPRGAMVVLTVFADRAAATRNHLRGVKALLVRQLGADIKFLRKNLALPYHCEAQCRYFGGRRALEEQLVERVLDHHLCIDIRTKQAFDDFCETLHTAGIAGWGQTEKTLVIDILEAYQGVRAQLADIEQRHRGKPMLQEFLESQRRALQHLVPDNFITLYDTDRLQHLPRYLKGVSLRAQRGVLDLEKDRAKAKRLAPYETRLQNAIAGLTTQTSAEKRHLLETLVWMLEEFKISIFAQEIKTSQPVSEKRLDAMFKQVEGMV